MSAFKRERHRNSSAPRTDINDVQSFRPGKYPLLSVQQMKDDFFRFRTRNENIVIHKNSLP